MQEDTAGSSLVFLLTNDSRYQYLRFLRFKRYRGDKVAQGWDEFGWIFEPVKSKFKYRVRYLWTLREIDIIPLFSSGRRGRLLLFWMDV